MEREIAQEISQLSSSLQASDRAPPATPVLVDVEAGKAVWRVTTRTAGDVFMSLRSRANNADVFVVNCDADRFYLAWLRSGNFAIPRQAMPHDYKYEGACRGFAHGRENPVPLADVAAYVWMKEPRVMFNNGLTRTFWLLANLATAFPVRVHGAASAQLLHHLAGVGDAPTPLAGIFSEPETAMRP